MVTLLGAMGRSDAAPLLADLACGEGAEALRWQALRQGLALDSEIGFGAVSAVSNRPEDPLSQAASDLKLRLEHAYPALIKKAAT